MSDENIYDEAERIIKDADAAKAQLAPFQDEPNASVSIVRGGAPAPPLDVVAKVLWMEGFAYPTERGRDLQMHYAVVTKSMIEAVLEKLYQVEVPSIMVIRYLRQVGLIQYADALSFAGAPMVFRYTCARAARDKEPKTIDDVERLIETIESVVKFLGPRPDDPRDAQADAQEDADE